MTETFVAEHAAFSVPRANQGGWESAETANLPVGAFPRGSQPAPRGLRVFTGLLRALHTSRSRQAAREIHRHRFLLGEIRAFDSRGQNAPCAGNPLHSADTRSIRQRSSLASPRLMLFLAIAMLAFGAVHVVGIVKLQASHAAHASVPAVTPNIGD